MSDCVDDRTPLLCSGQSPEAQKPFVRGSSVRTTVRRPRAPLNPSAHNPDNVPDALPPVPPRLQETRQKNVHLVRRSASITEDGNASPPDVPRWSRASGRDVRDGGRSEEWRSSSGIPVPNRSYISSYVGPEDSLYPSVSQGVGERAPRNAYQFSSMPRRRMTPPKQSDMRWWDIASLRWRPLSPSPSRLASPYTDERVNTTSENSCNSKPSSSNENSFFRRLCARTGRSQTPPPPCSSPMPSPVTYKRNLPDTRPTEAFRRYGSVPMKKSEALPHHPTGNIGRSCSFKHPVMDRRRTSVVAPPSTLLSHGNTFITKHPVYSHDFQRHFTPDERYNDVPGRGSQLVQPSDLPHVHSDHQRTPRLARRDPRRFSYLRGPLTPGDEDIFANNQCGKRAVTSTTSSPPTASPSPPPAALRPSRSLSQDSSPLQGSRGRSHSCNNDDTDGPCRHGKTGSPHLNLSRISSDSGYSTCTNASVASRTLSLTSEGEGEMIAWFGSRMNLREEESLKAKSPTDHFSYMMEKEEEYLVCLRSMLRDYQSMNHKTPSLIRQHFDLIFKQVDTIYNFQVLLQDDLRETNGRPDELARVFTNEQFQCYGRYMVMIPAVQRDLLQYDSHFKEHYPDLKRNILKPSLRINFYAMILGSFMKEASEEVKLQLQTAIDYLNQVKRKANTEMTLKTVVQSPVDLRLGGDMLNIGELYHLSGGPLQKKKYQVILFENLLVITSTKIPYFKYKTHYRVEQLESVVASGDNELFLNVLSEGQTQRVTLKFKTKSKKMRDDWMDELNKITKRNTRLTHSKASLNLIQIPRQQFRTLPLNLFQVFPLLKEAVTDDQQLDKGTKDHLDEYSLPNMLFYEDKYLSKLSSLLNPESQRPPEGLSDLLVKLHNLHSRKFRPALQSSKNVTDFLAYLDENLDELSVYMDYLVIRSQLTVKLDENPQAGPYISPVQHVFGIYLGLVRELFSFEKSASAQRVIKMLRENVKTAQVQVLKEAIVNGRVDFERSGELLMYSPMEVRTRKKEIRDGDYIVLLFESVIILTKASHPYYEYVMDIWLDQVNFGPPSNHDCTFRLEVRQGGRKDPITYELTASSVQVKQKWHRRLHQQMLMQVEKIRKRVTPTEEPPGPFYRY